MKARTLLICLICTLLLPMGTLAAGYPVTWISKKIEQTVEQGQTLQRTAIFTSTTELQNVEVWVVPELRPYLTVEPENFAIIAPNTSYTFSLNLSIPADTPIALYDGTVRLRAADGARTYGLPLPIELNVEDATALVLDVTLDEPNSVSAEITPEEGVKMETTAADGTHYTFEIPPNAIRGTEKVTVTVTPLLDIGNLPLTGGFMAGVHFAPEGLRLYKGAILSIELPTLVSSDELMGFSYQGLGNEIHFFPVLPLGITSSYFAFEVIHFSGAGMGTGCPPCMSYDLTTSNGYLQLISCSLAEACVYGYEFDDPYVQNNLLFAFRKWFSDLVLPTIEAATTLKALDDANHEFMLWEEQVQMFGFDDALLPELNTGKEAIGLALKSQFSLLLENLNAANTDEAVRKAIEEMWKWLRSVELWGYEHYLTDEEPTAMAAVCNAYKRGFSYLDANCRAASEHCEKRSLLLTFGELLEEAEVVCSDVDSDINIDNFCDYIIPSFINSVSIVKDDIRPIIIGEEIEVHATVENVDKQPLNLPVTWGVVEVSVADIVEVVNDNTVRIRGVGEGKATLAANVFECDTRFVDEVEIEVQAPSLSVKLNTEEATLSIGDTLELTAEMIDADGNPLQGYTFTWSSSNPDVASINPESGSSTLVSADSKGIATITATCEGVSGNADITVIEQQVSSVTIYPNAPTIKQGQTLPLTVKIFDTAMTEIECPSDIVWEIPPNESIAFDLATVTGVTPGGPVTITATCGGVSDSAEITVINQVSVLLSPPSITLERHQQQGFSLYINSDGTWRVCPDPEWTIPPGQVISFDPINQYVTGNYPGIATIYAACEGVTASANITVPGWRIKWKTSSFATGECEITFPAVYTFVSKESRGIWEGFALIATDWEIVEGEHSGSGYRHKHDDVIGECESTKENIDVGWSSTQTSNFVSAEWYMNVVEVDGKTYIKDPFLFGPWPPFESEFTTSSNQHRWGIIGLCNIPEPIDWTVNEGPSTSTGMFNLIEEEQYLNLVFEDYNPRPFFSEYFVYPGDIEAANSSATTFSKKFSYQYGTLFFPSSECTAPVTYTWDITIERVE